MRFLNQDTENLILQELFNLNHKFDKYQESNQRQFEEIREEIKTIKETMATKDELKALEAKMATKDELKKFATKEDLKKFATKEDLKKFATKEDLKRFATKEDLNKFATKEDLKKFPTKEDIKKFATKDELKRELNDVSQILQDTFSELQKREDNLRLELFEKVN